MPKKVLVVSLVASLTLLVMACSADAEDSCERANELCASRAGFVKSDCSRSSDDYDKLSDAQKEKADRVIECIDDADSCDEVVKCNST